MEDGYVRFWVEHDTEFAMLVAQDFRAAMNERDKLREENERWREVVKTFSAGNVMLEAEIERLQTRLAESEAENDQWQKKLAEVWAEIRRLTEALSMATGEPGPWLRRVVAENARLRADLAQANADVLTAMAMIDKHNDECRECPVIEP